MAVYVSRQEVILFKIESSEGVDASPSAGSDAILIENFKINPNPNVITTNESTPSLDPYDKIVGGMSIGISFDMYLKGSGAAATALELGKVLKACGFSETITGTAVPASAEALAAGGSTITAVLGASATGTAQLYRGMPVVFTGTVPGTSFIYDYTAGKTASLTDTLGGSLVATTNYQIPVNVLYGPADTSIPAGTIWRYNAGKIFKFTGWRGNPNIQWSSGNAGKISFTGMAMFEAEIDGAIVAPTLNATRPPIWKSGAFTINSVAAAVNALNVDMGGKIVQPDDPNQLEGFGSAIITAREPQGSMNPLESLVATRDLMGDFRGQTKRPIHARMGSVAGNRVALTIPSALYLNRQPGDQNGISMSQVPFHATGQGAGAFLCFY